MKKPDLFYTDKHSGEYRPTWSHHGKPFINEMHAAIYKKTEHLEGWQAEGDSQKLFEMGYYCGEAILEIGVYRGRSAVIQLLGAMHNSDRPHLPQYYGIDIADSAILRSREVLKNIGFEEQSLLFCGNIESFASRVDITPTSVFVDGDHTYHGAKKDLEVLSEILVEGTPVLCHDFAGPPNKSFSDFECPDKKTITGSTMWIGVQRACHEWEAAGYARFAGVFGVSGLYVTTNKCRGATRGLRPARFELLRSSLDQFYTEQVNLHKLTVEK